MKKLLSIVLVAAMVLCLCACQGGGKNSAELRVGFGRVNITPSYSVPLSGYGNTTSRMSQGFLDYIMVTCVAVTDENDSTVLLITSDLIYMNTDMVEPCRTAITEATGVPAERIMMQGTHTHSGPDMGQKNEPSIIKYKIEYVQGFADAAKQAMEDRSAAAMHTASVYPDGLNFIRHYTVSDGTVFGDNFGSLENGTLTGHTSDPDNELQLIRFVREAEDKKDIVMMNWQAHPKMASTAETALGQAGRAMLSADYVGPTRDYVEENTDCLVAFYLGASGNLNAFSKISSENATVDYREYGKLLGACVVEGLEEVTPVEGTTVKATQKLYEATIDKTEDYLYDDAVKIYDVWAKTNSYSESLQAAPDSGIISPYHATAIITRYNNTEGTRLIEINAVSVGNVGFVTAPYEMFDMNGMQIKDGSPFETTFVLTCANGSNNYIAAEEAFQFNDGTGSYEVHNRAFVRGTAEDLANNFVEMLKELKG